jgi:hypothetical protein
MTGGVVCSGFQDCSYIGVRIKREKFKILTSYTLERKETFFQRQVFTPILSATPITQLYKVIFQLPSYVR